MKVISNNNNKQTLSKTKAFNKNIRIKTTLCGKMKLCLNKLFRIHVAVI